MYFVIENLGYDGTVIFDFEDEVEANTEYADIKAKMDKEGAEGTYQGIALIRGQLEKSHGVWN